MSLLYGLEGSEPPPEEESIPRLKSILAFLEPGHPKEKTKNSPSKSPSPTILDFVGTTLSRSRSLSPVRNSPEGAMGNSGAVINLSDGDLSLASPNPFPVSMESDSAPVQSAQVAARSRPTSFYLRPKNAPKDHPIDSGTDAGTLFAELGLDADDKDLESVSTRSNRGRGRGRGRG
eukprot:Rmarinus@m.22296